MLQISVAGCLDLSLAILVQVSLEMCAAAKNHKNIKKLCSRSSMLIPLESSSAVLIMISTNYCR